MISRIRNRHVTLKIEGRRWCTEGKCAVFFMWWIILELLIFRYLWLMLKNTFSKLSLFIHSVFIDKIKVFWKILIQEKQHTTDFVFPTYFYFQRCLTKNITDDMFLKINACFYLMVLFCLKYNNKNVAHRWKAYAKTNNLTYNMLKSVTKCGSYCHLS